MLRSSEDAQRFAYVAAHDLRAPLNSSVSLLQMLTKKGTLGEDDQHILSLATAGLQRLQSLMGDILSYAQTGDPQGQELVTLQDSLNIALGNLYDEIEETGAKVECGQLPTVMGDRVQLVVVFQNLIGNAIKFRSPALPRIDIRASDIDGMHLISVADNGQGFDPQYAVQIFAAFKRLHGHDIPGSGIGLAACKRIVERLGGRIWAEAEPGRGSTFRFSLPKMTAGNQSRKRSVTARVARVQRRAQGINSEIAGRAGTGRKHRAGRKRA